MKNDNPIIAAFIAGISTVIVGLMGLLSSRKDTSSPSQKEIYETALNNVWAPLDKLLSSSPMHDPNVVLNQIDTIVSDHYKLIPPEFIKELSKIKTNKIIRESDFTKLKIITASYFNWIRKHLGYPFDKKRIIIEFSPRSSRDISFSRIGLNFFLVFLIGLSVMVFFVTFLIFRSDYLFGSDSLALAAVLFMMLLCFVTSHPRR